jgi:hypothetical protein
MQQPGQVGWGEPETIYRYIDPITKLTTLYLVISALALLIITVRFLLARGRVKSAAAVTNLWSWFRLTVLVLLLYSATEFAEGFRGISIQKMTGISALTGQLSEMFEMWTAGLWLLVALCIAHCSLLTDWPA